MQNLSANRMPSAHRIRDGTVSRMPRQQGYTCGKLCKVWRLLISFSAFLVYNYILHDKVGPDGKQTVRRLRLYIVSLTGTPTLHFQERF